MSRHAILYSIPVWLCTALVTAAIVWLTLAPQPLPDNSLPLIPGIDKIGHACMFAGLAAAIYFDAGLRQYKRRETVYFRPVWRLQIATGVIIFGLLTEFLQEISDVGREGDIIDWGADIVGTCLAVIIAPRLLPRIFNR